MQPTSFKKVLPLFILGWMLSTFAFGQYPAPYQPGNFPMIRHTIAPNINPPRFNISLTPLLNTVPGSFFSHLWWFGDNSFSFLPQPVHTFYPLRTGTASLISITTENYGSGGPPPIGSDITPNSTRTSGPNTMAQNEYVRIQRFRNAVRNDTMYCLVTIVKPPAAGPNPVNGKIIITNGQYTNLLTGFMQTNPSTRPNGETFSAAGPNILDFVNLKPGEERTILVPVSIDPFARRRVYMRVDVDIDGYDPSPQRKLTYDDIAVPVAKSHDPNVMVEDSDAENECEYGDGNINYTVQFQNMGAGPTQYVQVVCHLDPKLNLNTITEIELPKEYGSAVLLDELNGGYVPGAGPRYSIDHTNSTITFEFNDLRLQTLRAPNLTNLETTRSEVAFSIKVKPNYVFGAPVLSNAEIVFDENDPIETNYATTVCMDPLSIGDGGGFQTPPNNTLQPSLHQLMIERH